MSLSKKIRDAFALEGLIIADMQRSSAYYYRVAMQGFDPLLSTASAADLQREAAQRSAKMRQRLTSFLEMKEKITPFLS